MHKLLDNFIKI